MSNFIRIPGKEVEGMSRGIPRIGLLTDRIDYNYQKKILSGIMDMCDRHGMDFLCYSGGPLGSPYEYEDQRNIIFDLVGEQILDGIILLSGSLSNFITQEEYSRFYKRFLYLPMVSIAVDLPGVPSVLIDNRKGFTDLITHLIKEHHCTNIGFIKGPDANPDANIRHEVFLQVLKDHGIPVNPEYIAFGDFRTASGIAAAEYLMKKGHIDFSHLTSMHDGFSAGTLNVLKRRGMQIEKGPNTYNDLQAIVASNDNMAIGAMEAMAIRNILVPYDIIVTGFDNQEETEFTSPPLTTVDQPLYEQGAAAVELMAALLAGKSPKGPVMLQSTLLLRESCGCNRSYHELTITSGKGKDSDFPKELLESGFMKDSTALLGISRINFLSDKLKDLFDCFLTEIRELKSRYFILSLNVLLEQEYHLKGSLITWKNLLMKMYERSAANINDEMSASFAGELLKTGMLCIEETAKRQQAYERMQIEFQLAELRVIVQNISACMTIDELCSAVSIEFRKFGIDTFLLLSYATDGKSRFLTGFKGEQDFEIPEDRCIFDSRSLMPEGIIDNLGLLSFDIKPLFSGKDQLGFIIFNLDRSRFFFYETLRAQVSDALKSINLFRDREEAEAELEKALRALKKSHKKFKRLSIIDELTKLNNRRGFSGLVEAYFKLAVRRNEEFSLFYFDLDGLKKINDTYGHKEGDNAICLAAGILKKTFRHSDILGRLGGDEFAALCDRIGSGEVDPVVKRLIVEMDKVNASSSKPYKISLSYGIAVHTQSIPFASVEDMMVKADSDLYEQRKKRNGIQD
ncbi:MAG: GGDEF domain-containing protein [Spirochaetales bacterium]|nr:GGDEF domain-containing protein [Spirochaetales bacterium]